MEFSSLYFPMMGEKGKTLKQLNCTDDYKFYGEIPSYPPKYSVRLGIRSLKFPQQTVTFGEKISLALPPDLREKLYYFLTSFTDKDGKM